MTLKNDENSFVFKFWTRVAVAFDYFKVCPVMRWNFIVLNIAANERTLDSIEFVVPVMLFDLKFELNVNFPLFFESN
jgi:hypothetical protein